MEYKIMTREELEYMMMDLHVICLMKDEEIKTLKDENEMLKDRNEYLRMKNNQAVIEQGKEKSELKDLLVDREKQIKNWKHYYRILHAIKTEQVKENNQLKKQIDDLSDTCSEQLETIATLQKANTNNEARILIKDTRLENLEECNKKLKYDCEQLHKIIEEKRVKIVDYINEKELLEKDLDIQINTIKQLDKKLQTCLKQNTSYELKINELENKILDEQLNKVRECARCGHLGYDTCIPNPLDELVYENSELGKFNIHMYMREHEKLMKENEHLKKQIDELISIRYDLEDELSSIKYDFDNLNISLKKAIDEKMAMIEEIKIYIDTIKKLEAVEKNNPPVMDDTDCDSSELPYRADTESRPKFDDSVDCRPRKQ